MLRTCNSLILDSHTKNGTPPPVLGPCLPRTDNHLCSHRTGWETWPVWCVQDGCNMADYSGSVRPQEPPSLHGK
ncbi:hypothetical protein C2E23DRAFT_494347 [Lenzites betulinus]|nr:hypothetical protein C2E23DRAFT_494347 [Lenzites betulinus]